MKLNITIINFEPRAQELCESRSGRPGLPVPNKPTVSADLKQQHFTNNNSKHFSQPVQTLSLYNTWTAVLDWWQSAGLA